MLLWQPWTNRESFQAVSGKRKLKERESINGNLARKFDSPEKHALQFFAARENLRKSGRKFAKKIQLKSDLKLKKKHS